MPRPLVIVLDDSQNVARLAADFRQLEARAEVRVLQESYSSEEAAAAALADAQVVIPMRERTPFGASLLRRLPNLGMLALTGPRAQTLDLATCTTQGIVVSNTGGGQVSAATAELAFGLMLSSLRAIPTAEAVMRQGGWHAGVPLGETIAGKRIGIVGLGKLGSRVAGYAKAFGAEVVAWSQNLEEEAAAAIGVQRVEKATLFASSDIVSLHVVLSERTRGIVGRAEIGTMREGALIVNTARGPLIAEDPLRERLEAGTLRAAFDVFDIEPLPADHWLRTLPNVVLTPHLGYSTRPVFSEYYGESVENVLAFLDGSPIRVMNPEVLSKNS